jgi:hypothetical protein
MKANIEKPNGSKKHIVRVESSVWLPLLMLLLITVLTVTLSLNGISFISNKSKSVPQVSHVSYWCAGKKTAYPRTARIYPAIKNVSQIDDIERDLEKDTRCQTASVYGWQNVDCPKCSKDDEIKRLEKDLLMQGKELQRLGKGGNSEPVAPARKPKANYPRSAAERDKDSL